MKITASGLPLLRRCQLFPRLEWAEHETAEALLGSAFHALAAYAVSVGREPSVEYDEGLSAEHGSPQVMWDNVAPVVADLIPQGIKAKVEFAFAYDYEKDTTVALALEQPRDYENAARMGVDLEQGKGITETEIPGTIDLAIDCGDYVLVGDYKTGLAADVDSVDINLQLGLAGLALARLFNKDRARTAIIYVNEEEARVETSEMTALDFDGVNGEVRRLMKLIRFAGAQPNPLCKWCPGKLRCPATGKALMKVVPGLPAELRLTGRIESPAEATARVMLLPLVRGFVDAWEADIKAYADDRGGIATPEGVYRKTTREGINLDVQGAEDVLKDFGAAAAVEVKRSSSKAAIKRALKNGDNAKENYENILEKFRAIGAVTEYSGGHRIIKG